MASVGTWQLSVFTPAKYAVYEVLVQRRPSGANRFPLLPGETVEIVVTLSTKGAAFKGKLLGPSGLPAVGAMVFLNPADQGVARLLFGKGVARTDASGEFVFEGLPPGRYKAAGSFDAQTPEDVDWSDPSLMSVELDEGESLTSDVRLPG